MFCKNCGKELSDNAKFCSGCGTTTVVADDQIIIATTPEEKEAMIENALRPFMEDADEMDFAESEVVEPRKLTVWQRFCRGFLKFRRFCCFACSISTVGGVIALILHTTKTSNDALLLISYLLVLLGSLISLFACPIHIFVKVVKFVIWGMIIGLYLCVIGTILTTLVAGAIGAVALLAGQCFFAIPYAQTTLKEKIEKYN